MPSTIRSFLDLNRVGWLAGLPLLATLWAAATFLAAPVAGDALRSESAAVVRETGRGEPEPWLRIETAGRDLLALGEAPDPAARASALAHLAGLPGLRRLTDRTGLIETASPFVWTATRLADRIETEGSRPAEIGAAALAARLAPALPSHAILRDRARAARGAPDDFADAAAYLIARLDGLAPGAVAALSGTTLSLRGDALDAGTYDAARTQPPPGFSLGAVDIRPPLVDDFHFVAERRQDGGIKLDGNIVSEAARAAAIVMAQGILANAVVHDAASTTVDDTMRTARGLDPAIDPAALTKVTLRLAGLIREGSVRFERGALSVSGTALDDEAADEVAAAMRDERPAGVSAGTVALGLKPVSPYPVRMRREAGTVTLSGYLPDRTAREALNTALRSRFLRETVVDRSRISSGAPPRLAAVLTAAIGPLSTLASGEVAVADRTLRLTGESLYAESARRVGEDLSRALPSDWTGAVSVTARDAGPVYDERTCARLFAERLAGRSLRFLPGSSELRPEFYPVLDAVADLAKACRTERVEVVGHLDAPGAKPPKPATLPEAKTEKDSSDKAKADPSKKPGKVAEKPKPAGEPAKDPEPGPDLAAARAAAIVDYLLKAGVAPDRALAAQDSAPLGERQGIGLALRS